MTPLKLLIVEDFENDARLVVRALGKAGYQVNYHRVETADALREQLRQEDWDLIVSDFSLPDFGALEALEVLHQSGRDIPLFVVSSLAGEEAAVAVMKAGAQNYLRKDHLDRLPAAYQEEQQARTRRKSSPIGSGELREAVELLLDETGRLEASALPGSALHGYVRRVREAARHTLDLMASELQSV